MNMRYWLPYAKRVCSTTALVLALSGCAGVTISDPIPPPPAIPPSATPDGFVMMPTASPRPRRTPTATRASAEVTPTIRPTITPTPEPILYTVAAGDTLSEIATRYAVSLEDLMAINNLTDAHRLSLGQILIIPSTSDIVGEYAPATTSEGHIVHFVREGETISAIAAQYGVSRQDVLFANGFRPDVQLFAGDQIVVPQGQYVALATATLPPLEPVSTSAVALALPTETAVAVPVIAETSTPQPTPTPQIHTVASGEIAGKIAADYNITVNALAGANPNVNVERLSIGQQLLIPTAGSAAPAANATPTAVTLEPTATPTPIPPVLGGYTVADGETWATLASRYGVTEEELKAYNSAVTGDLTAGTAIQIPLGTPTPVPTPTSPPTMTPTPAPAYMEPLPLLPANGSTWVHWAGKAPLTLLWTSSGILAEDEYYVVRVRALNSSGEMIWDDSYWTQATSLKLEDDVLSQFKERVTLRWDAMVMRQTSAEGETPRTGRSLSNKSQTWEIIFSYSVAP